MEGVADDYSGESRVRVISGFLGSRLSNLDVLQRA